jgi:hypothetical protein
MKITEKHYIHEVYQKCTQKSGSKTFWQGTSESMKQERISADDASCTQLWHMKGAGCQEGQVLLATTDWASYSSAFEDLMLDGLAHCYQHLEGTCCLRLHLGYKREVLCISELSVPTYTRHHNVNLLNDSWPSVATIIRVYADKNRISPSSVQGTVHRLLQTRAVSAAGYHQNQHSELNVSCLKPQLNVAQILLHTLWNKLWYKVAA